MGLLGKILGAVSSPAHSDPQQEVGKILPVAECSAEECNGCGEREFPASVKIERDGPIWGSAPAWKLHILISTGKTDWKHDVKDEEGIGGKIATAIFHHQHELETKAGGRIKLNGSSLPLDDNNLYVDEKASESARLILLPYFLILDKVTPANVAARLEAAMDAFHTNSLPELVAGDPLIRSSPNKGYILLCSHRTRDKRCGITAPILRKRFEIELRHHNLYRDVDDHSPGGVSVLFVSHVGGHKFNANAFVYLNSGEALWMARVGPHHVQGIVEKTVLEGKAFPELMRSCFKSTAVKW